MTVAIRQACIEYATSTNEHDPSACDAEISLRQVQSIAQPSDRDKTESWSAQTLILVEEHQDTAQLILIMAEEVGCGTRPQISMWNSLLSDKSCTVDVLKAQGCCDMSLCAALLDCMVENTYQGESPCEGSLERIWRVWGGVIIWGMMSIAAVVILCCCLDDLCEKASDYCNSLRRTAVSTTRDNHTARPRRRLARPSTEEVELEIRRAELATQRPQRAKQAKAEHDARQAAEMRIPGVSFVPAASMADASSSSSGGSFAPGAAVRIFGLVKAAQHNGKTGTISAWRAASSGRVGVSLDDGSATLSVRPANLELLEVLPVAPPRNLKPLNQSNSAGHRARLEAVTLDGMCAFKELNGDYVRAPDHDESHFVSEAGGHLFYHRSSGLWMVSARLKILHDCNRLFSSVA
jgi:hypothetical protein